MLVPFPILAEKPGSFVAQFKFTVMITKGKTTALTGLAVDEAQFKTENSIKDQYVLDLLAVIDFLFSCRWTRQSKRRRRRSKNSKHDPLYSIFNCNKSLHTQITHVSPHSSFPISFLLPLHLRLSQQIVWSRWGGGGCVVIVSIGDNVRGWG